MIYLLVGSPSSGKTWVAKQLKQKFTVLEHDAYIGKDYTKALADAEYGNKAVLAETPFSMSAIMDPLQKQGIIVEPIFIIETANTLKERYKAREGKEIPKGHLTRTNTYLDRARLGGHFYGTSEEVLKYLKGK